MTVFDPFAAQLFTDNAFVATGGARTDVLDPATLEKVGVTADCAAAEVERVVERANAAQREWGRLDAKSRAGLLHRVADSIEGSLTREVAELMTREMGKPYAEAVGELANVAPVFRYCAEMARDEAGHIAGTTQTGSFQFARYEPYGVSVHIMPFNFPILLFAWTAAASLAAGNAVIAKPAPATTLSTLKFMEHFAALPPGLVSCLPGQAAVAEALIDSPGTHVVAFTGGVETGRKVAAACGRQLKPCIIEAGGNDPLIVTDSAPVEVAAAGAVTAAFHLSGQICTSAERLFVQDGIHDAFLEAFVRRTRALRIGNGLDRTEIGPLVSRAARDKVMALVDQAVAAGAKVECGGRVPPDRNTGWFYEPTILTGVTPEMEIMNTECFGPVAPICQVQSFDEALGLANRSRFGLGASVFTTRLDEAMRAVEELEAGMVWVNNPLIDNDALPFGGRKLSGMGRELGRQGLNAFRQSKMAIIDHQPAIQGWWYPYPNEVFHPGAE
ncbi:aldehyde dehydrogenase family protein [Rhodospirillaceae bacterium SYSU D60014]|uniref:aldehyde dehydrogenase family protein n=1 Tax=Virgifigura deserti TaxID=2268457 RepID=UPI000E671D96